MQRVLIIDDQAYVRAAVIAALRVNGFDAVAVNDGVAGLRAFQEAKFDLVIVDVYLPGMDGIKVIRELRARAPNQPIIAISGVQLGLSERTALDLLPNARGMARIACLKKPFRPPELLAAIHSAMTLTAHADAGA